MIKRRRVLLISTLLVLGIAGFAIYYLMRRPVDIRTVDVQYELSANDLVDQFNVDETSANTKYLDKIIAVKGTISSIKIEADTGDLTVILASKDSLCAVICSFYNDERARVQKLTPGSTVLIKGKCSGKLLDVVLSRCSMVP
jgi:DNA/RNA endonuclease YhcR with UshA esterase domain